VIVSSVKSREKNLDIKLTRSSFPFEMTSGKFTRTVENWVVWERNEKETAEEINRFIERNSINPLAKS
jgi:hypothetical protein